VKSTEIDKAIADHDLRHKRPEEGQKRKPTRCDFTLAGPSGEKPGVGSSPMQGASPVQRGLCGAARPVTIATALSVERIRTTRPSTLGEKGSQAIQKKTQIKAK
jgi:hypothetical protein